jgi:acyl-[acyl-carrier-protein] desaturase
MWQLPFDDPLEMLIYTVFQERATQVNYARLRSVVANPEDPESWDPVLANACRAIAADEVAHFDFFLSASLFYLYYFPERTLDAISRVLAFFEMPAAAIIGDYQDFITALYQRQIFGKKTYFREVVTLVCEKLGVRNLRSLDGRMKRVRGDQETEQGLPKSPHEIFDFDTVQSSIVTLFVRLGRFEQAAGIDALFETGLIPHAWEER